MGNVGIAGTLASFGVFTTGLLYWFTKPYVLRLEHARGSPSALVTTATLLGTPRSQTIRVADIRPVDSVHPLSSFQAGGRVFYVDPNAVRDPEMLALFAPRGPEADASAEKDARGVPHL
ncbi:hypothetical protein H632_c2460p0 [Helicosporidium sp. ATCC 50920]|nr:hypothetical protein H632_c2460p0 [Helicosporidium sp. ATCC 50920]|eukprot:KDD73173.1 hypothetical protein H632_c2460p0 [Helicosporidium sp. ATCC 50920]